MSDKVIKFPIAPKANISWRNTKFLDCPRWTSSWWRCRQSWIHTCRSPERCRSWVHCWWQHPQVIARRVEVAFVHYLISVVTATGASRIRRVFDGDYYMSRTFILESCTYLLRLPPRIICSIFILTATSISSSTSIL